MNASRLASARANTEAAQRTLQRATEATGRARARVAAARIEVDKLTAEDDGLVDFYARQLAEAARDGEDGTPAPLLPADGIFLAKRGAELTLAAALRALADLEATERDARVQVTRAVEVEQPIRDALHRTEVDRITAQIVQLRAEELRLCALLVAADEASHGAWLTMPAQEAINGPPARPSGEAILGGFVLTDINSPRGGYVTELENGREYWRDFRTQLDEQCAAAPAEVAA